MCGKRGNGIKFFNVIRQEGGEGGDKTAVYKTNNIVIKKLVETRSQADPPQLACTRGNRGPT